MGNPDEMTAEQATDLRELLCIQAMEKRVRVTIHKYAANDYRIFTHPEMPGTGGLADNGRVSGQKDCKSFKEVIEAVAKIKERQDGK